MTVLVTVSVNLGDPVTLHEIRRFLETAERNGADPETDLREYDENNDLVGLATVGELGPEESGNDADVGCDDDR